MVFPTVEYYSIVKRNEVLIHAIILVNFKNIMVSERNQSLSTMHCMVSFI